MREEIRQRFASNLDRVRNLVAIYRASRGAGKGRRPVGAGDILRSATVLLHASLEDVFRSIAIWRFPTAAENVLNDVPLVGLSEIGRAEKFFLGKLAQHRAKRVQDLIDESVRAYANTFTVNSTGDIAAFAGKVGVNVAEINGDFATLRDLFERRHHIVHQADRNDQPGQGHHAARSLSIWQVNTWVDAVNRSGSAFIDHVPG